VGTIPTTLRGIFTISTIDVRENNLTGEIDWIGQTKFFHGAPLQHVLLQSNNFSGTLSSWICSVRDADVRSNSFYQPRPNCCSPDVCDEDFLLVDATPQLNFLTELYHATDGGKWHNNSGWLKGEPCRPSSIFYDVCNNFWYGVECKCAQYYPFSEVYTVTKISLTANNLVGEIPSSIGNLVEILELYLDGNELSGTIPKEISGLTALTRVSLGDNMLTGKLLYPNLPSLTMVNVSNNMLGGSVPDTVCTLQERDLRHNMYVS
tara:strand:+ start:701 stop:1489 length:789 start_codon:yes stop_codon:yes gene_type:complete